MFEYVICDRASDDIFYKQDAALREHVPGLIKTSELQDVDGSIIYYYKYDGGEIKLILSRYTNGIELFSTTDIASHFKPS